MDARSRKDRRRHKHLDRRVQERVTVKLFRLSGETVVTMEHHCTIVGRRPNSLRLVSEEPLPIGERMDITFNRNWRDGPHTFSGIARSLMPLGWEPGYFVDVDLIQDRYAAAWSHQFH